MMLLATGLPTANHCDDRIIVTVPNGDNPVQIALTIHEALALSEGAKRAAAGAIANQRDCQSAEIVPFPGRRAQA